MPIEEEPVVGAVYEDEDGRSFEVISFDEDMGTLEVRYVDGTLNEIDLDDWYGMTLQRLESPEESDGSSRAMDEEGDDKDTNQEEDESEEDDDDYEEE
jgi:hypothetical protein